jgi:Glycosyltransferase family 87
VSWLLLHVGFYDRNAIIDTPRYQEFGDAMMSGEVPYRDFGVEYPPGALPVFLLPSLGPEQSYRTWFEVLMWVCAAATVAFVALALTAVQATRERIVGAVAFVALAPLALGSVVLTRFDYWPAALVAAALAAFVFGRSKLGFAVLGLAVTAKIYPLVLLPLALLLVRRRQGSHEALLGLACFAAVLAVVVVPFLVIDAGGLIDSVGGQLERPLQIESLGSSILLAAHQLGFYEATVVHGHGSQNLGGPAPDAFASVHALVQLAAIAGTWVLFARGHVGRAGFLAASAASVVAFVAFAKVLSPQFLIWLIPVVPLVLGRIGVIAAGLLAAALVTTQLFFPYRYWSVVALENDAWLVVVRNALLLALFAVLLVAIRREREEPRSA